MGSAAAKFGLISAMSSAASDHGTLYDGWSNEQPLQPTPRQPGVGESIALARTYELAANMMMLEPHKRDTNKPFEEWFAETLETQMSLVHPQLTHADILAFNTERHHRAARKSVKDGIGHYFRLPKRTRALLLSINEYFRQKMENNVVPMDNTVFQIDQIDQSLEDLQFDTCSKRQQRIQRLIQAQFPDGYCAFQKRFRSWKAHLESLQVGRDDTPWKEMEFAAFKAWMALAGRLPPQVQAEIKVNRITFSRAVSGPEVDSTLTNRECLSSDLASLPSASGRLYTMWSPSHPAYTNVPDSSQGTVAGISNSPITSAKTVGCVIVRVKSLELLSLLADRVEKG